MAMSRLVINGGRRLEGELTLHGAKNSALPLLAAAMLSSSPVILDRVPTLSDVKASSAILTHLGCRVHRDGDSMEIIPSSDCADHIPERLMREMRSSIVFLGAMLAKAGRARLCFPGGCELGPRPIDLHLQAFRQMGVEIIEDGCALYCHAPEGLHGARIALSFPSVGATENVLLAAVLAKGQTILSNAAKEPEIVDLCTFLNACGARIRGAGESVLYIEGVDRLIGCRYRVMPDRIEATTYLAAAAVTGGTVTLNGADPTHLTAVLSVFEEAGCSLHTTPACIRLKAPLRLSRVRVVRTMPYPGFPTDAQAPIMAMTAFASGTSVFIENIFDSRYKHVSELVRMGAQIKTEGRMAVVEGVGGLHGANVCCTDLRGGAALLVAGLGAHGTTEIGRLCHIDRGYVAPERMLAALGADIQRKDV